MKSLVDAAIKKRNDYLAFTFILNGNHNSRRYALCVKEDKYYGLLNANTHINKDVYLA